MKRYRTLIADSARWDGFVFRPDDIVICTPPKCGTTWTQMMCALLIFDTAEFDRPLAEISPWLDNVTLPIDAVVASLDAQTHRRFIKTHTPLDGVPVDERVTYLCVGRDPRDVAMSFEHHMTNLDMDTILRMRGESIGNDDLADLPPRPAPRDDPSERFWAWVNGGPDRISGVLTLATILEHFATFWRRRHDSNVALFHYGDFTADLTGQLRRLAEVLGIERSPDRIDELAHAATFDAMKSRAQELAPGAGEIWHDTTAFFHRGASGQWRHLVDDEGMRRYDERVAELVPPDLADWAHNGWLGATPD